ncbi:MAG: fibronectin type III domain-containing protein, partial [Campylobacterota bacterium]
MDENLPPVKNIKVIEDMSSIGFEWTTVLDSNIAGYVIYRSKPSQEDNKLDVIAKVDDKYSNHFVDYDLKPNTKYRYRFAVYTDEGTRGPGSKTITAQTMPMVEPISFIEAIDTLPRKSKIIWRPHSSRSVASYIIERKVAG